MIQNGFDQEVREAREWMNRIILANDLSRAETDGV
jgi:hypothetical protein